MPRLLTLVFIAVAIVLGLQLFVPPIFGLSDQGDFARVIGRFGYAREDRTTTLSEAYVAGKYVRDAHARVPDLEQPTSEYAFTGAAVLLNKVISRDGKLDIRVMGLVHTVVFLAVLARWLAVIFAVAARSFCGGIAVILAAVALTDVGYVAYWNSFYSEPASCIFFLLLLSESIALFTRPSISAAQVARWCLWAALLVIAKPQNFALTFLLVPSALRLGWRRPTRHVAIFGTAAIAIVGFASSRSVPTGMGWGAVYTHIFLGILPDSKNPVEDLQALGLDARYATYSGTAAYSPRTAFGELVSNGEMARISRADIVRFYLRRPARMWRRAKTFIPTAVSLRPEWCGNFERSAGFGPGAKSTSFTIWSAFHERVLSHLGDLILISLIAFPLAAIVLWMRRPKRRVQIELCALLTMSCLLSFAVAAYGDAWDNVKHCFLFNLQLDACLITAVCIVARNITRKFADR